MLDSALGDIGADEHHVHDRIAVIREPKGRVVA